MYIPPPPPPKAFFISIVYIYLEAIKVTVDRSRGKQQKSLEPYGDQVKIVNFCPSFTQGKASCPKEASL